MHIYFPYYTLIIILTILENIYKAFILYKLRNFCALYPLTLMTTISNSLLFLFYRWRNWAQQLSNLYPVSTVGKLVTSSFELKLINCKHGYSNWDLQTLEGIQGHTLQVFTVISKFFKFHVQFGYPKTMTSSSSWLPGWPLSMQILRYNTSVMVLYK